MARKAHATVGEPVECRTRVPFVRPCAESIRAQGVDQDEENVYVVTPLERIDVADRARGSHVAGPGLEE